MPFEKVTPLRPNQLIDVITDDPMDNKCIEAATAGKAKLIVSGDDHLLELKSFRDIPIITTKEFIKRLEG